MCYSDYCRNKHKTHGQKRGCIFSVIIAKYNTKKPRNQEVISRVVKHLSLSGQERFKDCANWIEFYANREADKLKVHQANFCKNRFCPLCAWRQAKKDALKISVLMKYIEQEHGKAFVFVTLTAPNVRAEDLKDEISRYNKAFKKMVERKAFKKINQGYIRKLEITYNAERNDYHPHFHVTFAVNPSYFKSRDYIKQETWLNEWRDVMNDQSITQVDVRKVKKNENGKEVNELAKYAAKDSDYTKSQEVFDAFYIALKGRQVLTYNGLFKEANKLFKADKLNSYIDIDETEYVQLLLYRWGLKEYVEAERRELTDEERREVNRALMDEIEIDED
jgi:plasmid rolling circle replication initiator protein Rep